jgi:ABC-type multidrug transport system permease subunit
MSATVPSLADVLTNILNAVTTILYEVTKAIADNAGVIATVLVLGGLAFVFMRYGTRVFRSVGGWFRGLF